MTQKSKTLPKWAQWLAGLAFMALVLTAGGLSLSMNLAAGLGVGIAVAIAFCLSDVAKVLLPIVCLAIGWTRHLKATYIAASIISVLCAVFYLADEFGLDILSKENAVAVTVNLDQRVEDLRASAKQMRGEAVAEGQRGGCGTNCSALHAKADRLDDQLAMVLSKRENVSMEKRDGKASVFASIFGATEAETSRGIALALIVATLIISELIVHASGFAAAMIGFAMQSTAKPSSVREKSAKAVAKLANDVANSSAKPARVVANRAYYLARLEREFPAIAKRVHAGELSVYRACVDAGLRKAPAKRSQWTKIDSYMTREKIDA